MSSLLNRLGGWALPLCIAAMDACWIYAVSWLVYAVLSSRGYFFTMPAPLALGALAVGSWAFATALLDKTSLSLARVQTVMGVVGVALAFALVGTTHPLPGAVTVDWFGRASFALIVAMAVWLLSGYRASERTGFNEAYRVFATGIAVMGVAVFLAAILPLGQVPGLGNLPVWFFGWSLVALALGNREVVRQEVGKVDGRFWGVVLAASVAVVMLVGLLSGAVSAATLLDTASKVAGTVVILLVLLVVGILTVIFWLASQIWAVLTWLLGGLFAWLGGRKAPPPPGNQGPNAGSEALERLLKGLQTGRPVDITPELWAVTVALVILMATIIMIIVAGVVIKRTQRDPARTLDEERESVGSWATLRDEFVRWLKALIARLRPARRRTAAQQDDLAHLRNNPEWSGTLSVRQLYVRLQQVAAASGLARHPEQTPTEYLRVLAAARPQHEADFAAITAAYITARYGPLPAAGPQVQAANEAWRRAEPALRMPSAT